LRGLETGREAAFLDHRDGEVRRAGAATGRRL